MGAHQSVEEMSRRLWLCLKRHVYVTPTNYLETVRNYRALLAEKRGELSSKANKLQGGLLKLDETRVQVRSSQCGVYLYLSLGSEVGYLGCTSMCVCSPL